MKIGSGFIRYWPVVLFVFVALHQLLSSSFSTLSRWKGGGMGMYSELSPATRSLLVVLTPERGEDLKFVLRPDEWPRENFEARAFPRPASLEKLANQIKSLKWAYRSGRRDAVEGKDKDASCDQSLLIHPRRLRIEVRRVVFDASRLALTLRPVFTCEESW